MKKIDVITMGCSKNLVDSERVIKLKTPDLRFATIRRKLPLMRW
jgi:tRNA A37 methylthiotransferase MiaB